jgi:hypothetical protein
VWWWEYFENRGMLCYFRGVRYVSDQMINRENGNFVKVNVKPTGLNPLPSPMWKEDLRLPVKTAPMMRAVTGDD